MPVINHKELRNISSELLKSVGASNEESEIIARHCIDANLVGHDSHGIIQIPTYIDRVERGHIIPGAEIDILKESPTTTVVDGNWGFGYVVAEKTMNRLIEKAKTHSIAAGTIHRQSHIGRLADYPIMAANENMIGIITADSGRSAKNVAPFGGREKRLGTNPLSIAMPSNLDGPFFLDMATSAVAAGKISLASARNESIPEGWILDKNGNSSTNPNDLKDGGVMLPLGGQEGHKGYGLSSMIEIFSGILPGLGFGHDPSGRHNDGCFLAVFNISAFRDVDEFKKEVSDFAMYLKSSKTATGFSEVYYPGEIEQVKKIKNISDGINVEDKTWQQLKDLANHYEVLLDYDF